MTLEQAAVFTDYSPSYLKKLVQYRQIPHSRPPGRKKIFFSKVELEQWLLSGRRKTQTEMESEAALYIACN